VCEQKSNSGSFPDPEPDPKFKLRIWIWIRHTASNRILFFSPHYDHAANYQNIYVWRQVWMPLQKRALCIIFSINPSARQNHMKASFWGIKPYSKKNRPILQFLEKDVKFSVCRGLDHNLRLSIHATFIQFWTGAPVPVPFSSLSGHSKV